jgi:hypothetical protein
MIVFHKVVLNWNSCAKTAPRRWKGVEASLVLAIH